MRKLWLKLGLPAILSLGSVVGAEISPPVPICTVDGAPSDCTGPVHAFGSFSVESNQISVSVGASADLFAGNDTATAEISFIYEATTEGPVRPGLIFYLCGSNSIGSFPGGGYSSASAGGIGCNTDLPGDSGVRDIILGTPFAITGDAYAFATRVEGVVAGGAADTQVSVEFYELLPDGGLAPVNIVLGVDVPEPNTLMLTLLGGAGLLCRLIHRSRRYCA